MISVEEALERLFALVAPLEAETVPLAEAAGRVLASPVVAARAQPPFDASAMDGYAITDDEPRRGKTHKIVGTSAAGSGFFGALRPGEAVRIFTGAPVPPGGKSILIQEDATVEGNELRFTPDYADTSRGQYIRRKGFDFPKGHRVEAPLFLRATDLGLLGAMGAAELQVARRPKVALIATGNELVLPGEAPAEDQIYCSNTYALAAMVKAAGGAPEILPISRDDLASLDQALSAAAGADLVVTIGGASVGDHDLVADATAARGMERSFYKVLMRPGKPLMAGKLGDAMLLGLPGNPVSSIVCGHVFMVPVLRALQGLPAAPAPRETAHLAVDIAANAKREHYMRARFVDGGVEPLAHQDSSLMTRLVSADVLAIRPPEAGPAKAGDPIEIIRL